MHFLVVEDDDEARNLLVELLQESFPGSTVDQAITVAGALAEIQRCAKAGIVLDAAVLDFKLPLNLPGDNPETSEAACQMIRKTMGKTPFIVHISAFARTDSAIQDHLRCEHLNQGDTRVHFEEKFGEDAAVTPRRILKTLKAETYGPPIEQQLEAIFGRDFSLQQRSHRRSRPTAWRGTTTHPVGKLCRNIEEHWHDLDEGLQEKIRRALRVEEKRGRIRVTLV